jgi:hypothetical protein
MCVYERERERERERETIFINVDRRVAINLLDILQQSLQTPGCNRKLSKIKLVTEE